MEPICISPNNWSIQSPLSHTNPMSPITPSAHPKSASVIVTLCFGPFLKRVKVAKSCVVPHNVQGKSFNFRPTIYNITSFHPCVSPHSYNPPYYITFLWQFRVDDGGYIMASLRQVFFPSNSTHYPRIRLRNTTLPWNLHASMVCLLSFDNGFTSMTPDRLISWMFDFNSLSMFTGMYYKYLGSHWHHWWFPSHLLIVYIHDQ